MFLTLTIELPPKMRQNTLLPKITEKRNKTRSQHSCFIINKTRRPKKGGNRKPKKYYQQD